MSEPSTQQAVAQVVTQFGSRPALDARIAEVCERIGVTPRVHVRDVDSLVGADGRPAEHGVNTDSPPSRPAFSRSRC
ncbi:MAG: hypothetical protein M3Y77_20290 [Actinomycetota bacterium]|nr:hypothetical protein [Actinomycetota bacterium]